MHARLRLITLAALLGAALLALVAPAVRSRAQQDARDYVPDQVVLQPSKESERIAASGGGEYLSPPTEARQPFSTILVRREASVPPGAQLTLFVRASIDGQSWSKWGEIIENEDMWVESDGPDVMWSQIIDVGLVARFWQVRGVFVPAPDGAMPTLRRIEVNTVDVTGGPEPAGPDQPPTKEYGLFASSPRPAVVSRTAWGSPDGQGSRARPAYYAVRHLVVHHTADSNSLYPGQTSWAQRVRAIWTYHAITRGWGDIGYNYLIDPNGVVYEGRAGGDDAVAFHDTANYGSMGVALLGTYQSVTPTAASQDALVRLLAWKASQKGIDPLGSSYYYGCSVSRYCAPFNPGAVVPNIAGHRQVTPGHTTCPGDAMMALLPGVRNLVRQLITSGGGDNGDLLVDELEGAAGDGQPGFQRSAANWYSAGCGAGDNAFYTFATDNPAESTNRGTWRAAIPARGNYHVYAHIPSGCGPGAATTRARYRIDTAGGSVERTIDQSAVSGWVDLGSYTFDAGSSGAVSLDDLTGEPFSAQRVVFFDAVKWVPASGDANIALIAVQYDRTTLASGELLRVSFTVRNTGQTTLFGQAPRVDLSAPPPLGDPNNGHVYAQDECFVGDAAQSYPAFPKESDRFRVVLGTPTWDADNPGRCAGATSSYPWRWGLNADLAPGQEQTIVGYVLFDKPGTYTVQAGIVQEYVRYFAQGVSQTLITVTPERMAPDVATYDDQLRPQAQVYRLGAQPDNFLARAADPNLLARGEHVGSFAWAGEAIDWGADGPFGLSDQFLIEQTRSFIAPTSGEYTFRTTSDDGSWLRVDGQIVVSNHGLHPAEEMTGAMWLDAGIHVLTFIYFDRGGLAAAGYDYRPPSAPGFQTIPDALASTPRFGSVFTTPPELTIAADDHGSSGVSAIRWSWDGASWQQQQGGVARLGRLQNGAYRLRYQAVDAAGNQGPLRELAFSVNTNLVIRRIYLPWVSR